MALWDEGQRRGVSFREIKAQSACDLHDLLRSSATAPEDPANFRPNLVIANRRKEAQSAKEDRSWHHADRPLDIVKRIPVGAPDLSLSGAGLELEARPAVGERVRVGRTEGRVVRHTDEGIAVEFGVADEW